MVRQTAMLSLCCCMVVGCGSSVPPSETTVPVDHPKVQLIVNGTSVTLNDTALPFPTSRLALVNVLGEPSRVTQPAYTILTWDEHGLYATEEGRTGRIIAITVALDKEPHEYWPKKPFSGTVRVDDAAITAQSKVEDINRDKKGEPFERNAIISRYWAVEDDPIVLTLEEANPDHKRETAQLSRLEIAWEPKK